MTGELMNRSSELLAAPSRSHPSTSSEGRTCPSSKSCSSSCSSWSCSQPSAGSDKPARHRAILAPHLRRHHMDPSISGSSGFSWRSTLPNGSITLEIESRDTPMEHSELEALSELLIALEKFDEVLTASIRRRRADREIFDMKDRKDVHDEPIPF